MKLKNFILAGIIGGIVDFFLGWIFYDFIFKPFLPVVDESQMNLTMIFFGCMTLGFFLSFLIVKSSIVNYVSGMKFGAVVGLFLGLYTNFFQFSSKPLDLHLFLLDTFIGILLASIVGGVIAVVNRKI